MLITSQNSLTGLVAHAGESKTYSCRRFNGKTFAVVYSRKWEYPLTNQGSGRFEWGIGGPEADALAYSILYDHLNGNVTEDLVERFVQDVVTQKRGAVWEITTAEIRAVIEKPKGSVGLYAVNS